MNATLFNELPLADKAALIKEQGLFIEAQDFYSFFTLTYVLNQQRIKLLYDFSGLLAGVEIEDASEEFI